MANKNNQNIIIKKVKKVAGGHHGGAWKVAYADFVTAMMAFFLLMWLMSSVPTDTLKGVAEYFTPTIGVVDGMGIGFDGGKTPQRSGASSGDPAPNTNIIFGAPSTGTLLKNPEEVANETQSDDFSSISQSIEAEIKNNKELSQYSNQIVIDTTPEGLRIQIVDKENRPIFKPGTNQLEDYSKAIITKISQIVRFMPNYLAIHGYTNGTSSKNFDHWTISAERALVARNFMQQSGIDEEQFARVSGNANHDLLIKNNPDAPENIRIGVVLLRKGKKK